MGLPDGQICVSEMFLHKKKQYPRLKNVDHFFISDHIDQYGHLLQDKNVGHIFNFLKIL